MADEARLIFELVDRSGSAAQPGASAPQGPQPSGPGGDPVGDAQQRNRPNQPQPTGPQPVQQTAPDSPRPGAPAVQPATPTESRWGDLIATLSDIGKTLGLTATLQQTAAGQILSFGMRAFSAAEKAADAIQKFAGKAMEQPSVGGRSPLAPTVSAAPPVTVETVRPEAPKSPEQPQAQPIAPEAPERSPFDNGDVLEGVARPVPSEPQQRPALPAPRAPAPAEPGEVPSIPAPPSPPTAGAMIPSPPRPTASAGGLIPRPTLPAVVPPSAGLPAAPASASGLAIPAAAAAAPVAPLAASAAPLAAVAAVAVPVAVVAAGAYGAYKTFEATNAAARQIAAGDAGSLSPDIARANAEQNIRELAANLTTAARIGDLVADNVAARGRLAAEAQEFRDTVLATTIPATNKLTNALAGAVAVMNDIVQTFGGESTAKTLGDIVAWIADWKSGGTFGLLERYAKAAEEDSMRKILAESPLTVFDAEPLMPLPAPFTAGDDKPLDAKFNPIPGLEL